MMVYASKWKWTVQQAQQYEGEGIPTLTAHYEQLKANTTVQLASMLAFIGEQRHLEGVHPRVNVCVT